MCQKDSENLYSLYVEEIRIFCNLEVQESKFVFIASKEKSLKAVTPWIEINRNRVGMIRKTKMIA